MELVVKGEKWNDVTTSVIVGKIFGKDHDKVCRDIKNLNCSLEFNTANFGVIKYIDSRGREQECYEITKDGFSFLVMGYTGIRAGEFKEAFINEFNRRGELIKTFVIPKTLSQALMLAAEQAERIENQEMLLIEKDNNINELSNHNKIMKPKVVKYDKMNNMTSNDKTTRDFIKGLIIDKKLKVIQNDVWSFLRENKYISTVNGVNTPMAKYLKYFSKSEPLRFDGVTKDVVYHVNVDGQCFFSSNRMIKKIEKWIEENKDRLKLERKRK